MAEGRKVLVVELPVDEAEALVTIPLGSSQERHEARVRGRKRIRAALDAAYPKQSEEDGS